MSHRPTLSNIRFSSHARNRQDERDISRWLISLALQIGVGIQRGVEKSYILTAEQLESRGILTPPGPLKVVLKEGCLVTVMWMD